MGQPAARVTDPTTHGAPLTGSGCPTVKIAGLPAWRALADTHICPLSDGPKPHVGGPVVKGSLTVRIGGMAATRQGDLVIEAGPPNPIAAGAPNVLIGG